MATLSVRLDTETERLLERIARRRRQSKSQVVRDALAALARKEMPAPGQSPYDAISHLIGCVRGGPADLSERTGKKFRKLLERKRGRQ